MANTINSEEKLLAQGGINHGQAFKFGQLTSSMSIPATVQLTSLSDEEKAEQEYANKWAAYKKSKKDAIEAKYPSKKPSDLLKETNPTLYKQIEADNKAKIAGVISDAKSSGASLQSILQAKTKFEDELTGGVSAIVDTAAGGAGQLIGTAVGTAGAIAGQVAGMPALIQGTAEFAADLVSQTIADITAFAIQTVTDRLVAIIKPPSIGDIMAKAGQVCLDYIAIHTGQELSGLLINAEELTKLQQQFSIVDQVAKITGNITKTVNKVKKKIEDYTGVITKVVNEMKQHVAFGKEWLQDKCDLYSADIKDGIGEFIDENTANILKVKEQAIEGLGIAIGESLGKIVVDAQKKAAKKSIDKIREKTNNVTIQANAQIGKAKLNLMAKVGG